MDRNEIPTAKFKILDEPDLAKEYIESVSFPLVIKADGLAAGKGVIVCDTTDEALSAVDKILVKKSFGEAGKRIVVEERIDGIEASYIALSDGETVIPLATSQDHKRIFDDDKGSNTGGMGAYSPTGAIDDVLAEKIQTKIIRKTVDSLKKEGIVFKGFLYAGVMIRDGEPYVLEFNARMGDPECQPMVIRMNSDLFEYLTAVTDGNLSSLPSMSWKKQSAVCVVLASNGYPESYPKNEEITGLSDIPKDSFVFHAGTKDVSGKIVTNGGRVLSVTSLGDSLQDAISNTYKAAEKISWPSKYYRHDIGKKGLSYL